MLVLGLLPLFLMIAFPMLREAVAQRIAITVVIVLCTILVLEISFVPRRLRLGIVPAWVAVGMLGYVNRLDSPPVSVSGPGCEAVTDREPPAEIFLDSLDHAIGDSLSSLLAEDYLDLICVAFLVHSRSHTDWPLGGVNEALRELGLEGEDYERFSSLARYRTRQVEGGLVFDAWFCGYDRECYTCDDRGATYRWPQNRAAVALPTVWSNNIGVLSEISTPRY